MNQYKIENKTILINNNQVTFENTITRIEEVNGYLILLLENIDTGDVTKQPLNNIYALDNNCKLLWSINDIVHNNEYFGIFHLETDVEQVVRLITRDCMGIEYTINLNNMKIEKKSGYRF